MTHQSGAYPSFCSMKRLGVFLLAPEWDASPSQAYTQASSSPVPKYTSGWREALREWNVLPNNTILCPRPRLEHRPLARRSSALTMRPPRLPRFSTCGIFKLTPKNSDLAIGVNKTKHEALFRVYSRKKKRWNAPIFVFRFDSRCITSPVYWRDL